MLMNKHAIINEEEYNNNITEHQSAGVRNLMQFLFEQLEDTNADPSQPNKSSRSAKKTTMLKLYDITNPNKWKHVLYSVKD